MFIFTILIAVLLKENPVQMETFFWPMTPKYHIFINFSHFM